MAYSFSAAGASSVTATELVTGIYDQVAAAFVDVKYGEILWRKILPLESIKTDVNPGAMNYIYRSRDMRGMGQFVRGNPNNIPRVGQVIGQVSVPILDGAVGATLMDSDARRYAFGFPQSALAKDYGEIMRRAVEFHIERTFFFGNAAASFSAFIDYPSQHVISGSAWTGTDPTPWVKSLQDAIYYVYNATRTVHLPNRILLPPGKFSMLLAAYVIGSGPTGVAVSALEFLKTNNLYTALTGRPLVIEALRYLTNAGTGDRAVIYEDKPDNLLMPFPMPYQLSQPVSIPLGVEMFAEYAFGSFNMPFPASMTYMDGI